MTTKKIIITISIVIVIIAAILAIVVGIFQDKIFGSGPKPQLATTSFSSKSESQRSAFYFPRFFNPSDKIYDNVSSSTATTNLSSAASRSLPALFNIETLPIQKDKMQKTVYKSSSCPDNTNTTHGITEVKLSDNSESSLLIAHKSMILDKSDSSNYERAINFLTRNTDFMADTNTTFGPDYLQFLRRDCTVSNIQKIKEFRSDQFQNIPNTQNNRALTDIRGLDNNLFINFSIYGKKDENVFVVTKSFPYADLLTRDEKDGCTTNNAPVRSCIKKIIANKADLDQKFVIEAKKLAADYSF